MRQFRESVTEKSSRNGDDGAYCDDDSVKDTINSISTNKKKRGTKEEDRLSKLLPKIKVFK